MDDWTEELPLSNGQKAVLLKRYPAERANMVRVAVAREEAARNGQGLTYTDPALTFAIARASLWDGTKLKDYLTGAPLDLHDYGKADPRDVDKIEAKALVNYVTWAMDAYPGPKDSTGTEPPTSPSENPEASETDAKA